MSAWQVVVMGVSGCGKSTVGQHLADLLGCEFLEGDSLHPPRNVALMAAGTPLTDADRADWLATIAQRLRAARLAGRGLVVSCSALKRAYRDQFRAACPGLRFVHLQGDAAQLQARMDQRTGHYMPLSLLASQLATLEPPTADEQVLALDIDPPAAALAAAAHQHLQTLSRTMITADTFRLDGRLALVTGSSSGIGLALARGLGQAGAALVLNGRDAAKLAQAAATLRAEGLTVHERAFDVTDAASVEAAVAAIEAETGAIDILVNNAGIQRRGPFHEFAAEDWQAIMRTNVDSLFHVGQAVARRMVPRRAGRIINIASVQAELGRPGIAPYAASKGAVKMLTKGMAIDLGPHGINVNGLGPGYFKTELTQKLVDDPAFTAWLTNRTPNRRWGEVEELAPAVVFLASDASRFVNGHILYVDGGVTATL